MVGKTILVHVCVWCYSCCLRGITKFCFASNADPHFLSIQSSCRDANITHLSHPLDTSLLFHQALIVWSLFSLKSFFEKRSNLTSTPYPLYTYTSPCTCTSQHTSPLHTHWLSLARQSSKLTQLSPIILYSARTWIIGSKATKHMSYSVHVEWQLNPEACLHALSLFWILSPFYLCTAKNVLISLEAAPVMADNNNETESASWRVWCIFTAFIPCAKTQASHSNSWGTLDVCAASRLT